MAVDFHVVLRPTRCLALLKLQKRQVLFDTTKKVATRSESSATTHRSTRWARPRLLKLVAKCRTLAGLLSQRIVPKPRQIAERPIRSE